MVFLSPRYVGLSSRTLLLLYSLEDSDSVVRLSSLNYFNYATIISLFGVIGYIVGSTRFVKKDLPL